MALSGSFHADFESFYNACQKAEVSLRGFESGSGKVETSLNRMTDSLSGVKIVQQATIAAEAVERIGGASKLTEKELQRVGAMATEAAAKLTAMGETVPPKIQALADAVKKVPLDDLNKKVPASTGFFNDLSGSIVTAAAGFVSAQAIIGAFTTGFRIMSDFVAGSVKAYADAEAADVKLTAALRQHSLATPEVIAQYAALGATFQRTTRYSDDEIQSMERLLTQVGNLMPSQMQGALKASTDLAAGLGIDLQSATNLVAKAAAGHTATLGKYGITVSEAALATKGFDAVLEAINRQFGGQAQADVDTYAGKMQQMANAWNNVEEAVGKFVVMNPLAVAAMRELKNAVGGADEAAAQATPSFAGMAEAIGIPGAGSVILFLEAYAASTNAAADATERISKIPKPFEGIMATLPPITAGMKLFNESVVEDARVLKESEAASKAWKTAMIELNSVGVGWRGTLDGIDGEVVEAIKFYLAAGVAQGTLAAAYGLTAVQVKAVSTAMAEELAMAKVLADFKKSAAANQDALDARAMAAIEKVTAAIRARQKADEDFLANELKIALAVDAANAAMAKTPATITPITQALDDTTRAANAAASAFAGFTGMTFPTQGSEPTFVPGGGGGGQWTKPYGFGPGSTVPIKMPKMEAGGPVMRDGPIFAHAGEFVVPKGGGAPMNITINVNGSASPEETARRVMEKFLRSTKVGVA